MQAFTVVSGAAVPLRLPNIDTDVIIRVERMSTRNSDSMRQWAFEALRYRPDGSVNPDCVLNAPAYENAPILLAGDNFGCGSSREPAVWAIMALGVRCIIAESFGDIFFGNCFQNGILPIVLPAADIAALAQESGEFTVDLPQQRIVSPSGRTLPFSVDPLRKESLVEGLDEIGQTLKWGEMIRAWQAGDKAKRAWVWG